MMCSKDDSSLSVPLRATPSPTSTGVKLTKRNVISSLVRYQMQVRIISTISHIPFSPDGVTTRGIILFRNRSRQSHGWGQTGSLTPARPQHSRPPKSWRSSRGQPSTVSIPWRSFQHLFLQGAGNAVHRVLSVHRQALVWRGFPIQ